MRNHRVKKRLEERYDEVAYHAVAFAQTAPERLATIARLYGVEAPAVATARVLEIGCANGANLIPLAQAFPKARFLGLDLSSQQIADGQRTLEEVPLENVELRAADLREVDASWGVFDYLVAHGVYSWVPPEVQQKLLEVCSQNLSPAGIAYVSYNTYPGWRMREGIREMMAYHAARFDDPTEQVARSRGLVETLSRAYPEGTARELAEAELRTLDNSRESYALHEHLAPFHHPCYFHEFMAGASQYQLQYLGDTDLVMHRLWNSSPEIQAELAELAGDNPLQYEQYLDFFRNRMFRCSLLCHADVDVQRPITLERLADLYVWCDAQPAEGGDIEVIEFVKRNGRRLRAGHPVTQRALGHLASIWPAAVSMRELCRAVWPDGDDEPEHLTELCERLHRLVLSTFVRVSIAPDLFTTAIGSHPRATPLARWQAAHQTAATNLRHGTIELAPFTRRALSLLDGRSRDEILASLQQSLQQGDSVLTEVATADTPEQSRAQLAEALDEALTSLAQTGFLAREGIGDQGMLNAERGMPNSK